MHFFTQAASGALPLCLAPHIESLIYPETFAALVSAAIAGRVESARTARNNFMLAPMRLKRSNNRQRICTPRPAILASPGMQTGLTPFQATGSGSALV